MLYRLFLWLFNRKKYNEYNAQYQKEKWNSLKKKRDKNKIVHTFSEEQKAMAKRIVEQDLRRERNSQKNKKRKSSSDDSSSDFSSDSDCGGGDGGD